MDYNLGSLRKRVAVDKLDDEEYEAEVIDRFINDTVRNIYNQYELPFQEKIYEGTVGQGVTMFSTPDDLALLQFIIVTGPDGSQKDITNYKMDYKDFYRRYKTPLTGDAAPISYWTQYAGKIILSQPTDQDYTVTMFYIKKPTKLDTDTSVPELPEEFSELIVLGAYMRVLRRDQDFDLANVVEQDYNNQVNLLVSRYGFRIADGPVKMKNQQLRVRTR